MRIMTILGTRPEIIRLSRVIPILDANSEHVLVHTGQNYDDRLNDVFFRELGVRSADYHLSVKSPSFAGQISQILERCESIFMEKKPDRILILGDTNSGIAALVARRLGIPVYHMESGNRCYDDRVPEEVNRRVIDHCSSVLMPYTERSRQNLIKEGIAGDRIYVIGNPIKEVVDHYSSQIASSGILKAMGLAAGHYFLVTMHRAENVDVESRLGALIESLVHLHAKTGYPVVCSFHPRTRARVEQYGIDISHAGLQFVEPFGFFDFIKLEQQAYCLLSDSGTVQEEACIFGIPNVTIRDVTERPETLEAGSNILAGAEVGAILDAVHFVTARRSQWVAPREYMMGNVADLVGRIVLGYRQPDSAEMVWRANRSC